MLRVGTWLNQREFNSVKWQIVDDHLGNIGVGYIGEHLGGGTAGKTDTA